MADASAAASTAEALKTVESLKFLLALSWGVVTVLFGGLVAFGGYIFTRFDRNQESLKKSICKLNRTLTIIVERHNSNHGHQANSGPVPHPDLES